MISIISFPKRSTGDETDSSEHPSKARSGGDEDPTGLGTQGSEPEQHFDEASSPTDDGVQTGLKETRADCDTADVDAAHLDSLKAQRRRRACVHVLAYGFIPGLIMLSAVAVGYLRWQDFSARDLRTARAESVHAATDSTIKMLSYRPDTVENDLASAGNRMTGTFRDSYTQLIRDVVIPGSKQRRISAVATVPAAASVSVTPSRAVVLLFVNQSIIVGTDPPSSTASSVKVTLDRVNNHWLISDFTPI